MIEVLSEYSIRSCTFYSSPSLLFLSLSTSLSLSIYLYLSFVLSYRSCVCMCVCVDARVGTFSRGHPFNSFRYSGVTDTSRGAGHPLDDLLRTRE